MSSDLAPVSDQREPDQLGSVPLLVARGGFGGLLMGLANLVPGISGGTMLLAAGIYPKFIQSIAELSTLRFRARSVTLLASVVIAAGLAIVLLAGVMRDLVVDHRWVMYSLFIGLTLGGVPVLWDLIGRQRPKGMWFGAAVGLFFMAGLAWLQSRGGGTAEAAHAGLLMMFLAGLAGASAMILPGVSGGYLLLVLGVYVPILSAIQAFKEALGARDFAAAVDPGLQVVVPVGVGVVVGILLVSNVLKVLLARHEKPTLGALLGLLLGAVVGLYPFQEGVAPEVGQQFRGDVVALVDGQRVMRTTGKDIDPEKYPTAFFSPTGGQLGAVLGLVVVGFGATVLVARIGVPRDV